MNGKIRQIIHPLLILVMVGVGAYYFYASNVTTKIPSTEQPAVVETVKQIRATFLVEETSYDLLVDDGSTVLSAMTKLDAAQENFSFSGTESEYGVFVDSINEKENNATASDYWTLYINGAMSLVGASDAIIQEGDVIEWKYEHVDF